MDSGLGNFDAWELTGQISPRRVVRAAVSDASGQALNVYPLLHPITGPRPTTPWAVHLADKAGRFHLLCFDLDAKTSPEAADHDASLLTALLAEQVLPHLVCASGPTGGRHVWIGLAETLDAELVGVLARLLKAWLPSVDVAPLTNPATGCVRPPGAPHRLGGTSQILAGSLNCLLAPTVTPDKVRALVARLAEQTALTSRPARTRRRSTAETDGAPHLPGPRRGLSTTCRALLEAVPTGDCSAVLWQVLCGAAAARWTFADVEAIVSAPGLEHARTMRSGATRLPRPPSGAASTSAVLRRQWARAVEAVANLPSDRTRREDDATFEARAEITAAVIRAVQGRADATPGRWGSSRSGLAQRRVLDALCLLHLQGMRVDEVEADIRRLALMGGIDRETARRSLLALAADGWIVRTNPSVGRRGARWSVDPAGVIHRGITATLSQADPRPPGAGPAQRAVLCDELADRLDAAAHDAFAPTAGLGIEAGSLFGRLSEPTDTWACGQEMGWTVDKATRVLARLASAGLVVQGQGCWRRTGTEHLDRVAVEQGTDGHQLQRGELYAVERAAWAWWQAELAWMRARGPLRFGRRRGGVQGLRCVADGQWPAHPRRRGGRADFGAARQALAWDRALPTPPGRRLICDPFLSRGRGEVVSPGFGDTTSRFVQRCRWLSAWSSTRWSG